MFYKTFSKRLVSCGWTITEEVHGGNIYPHYFKYDHPAAIACTIELVCASNKDGTPGRIVEMWQGGKPCRI